MVWQITDFEMLEDPGFSRETGWLRCCHGPAGEDSLATGTNLHDLVGA
jgi:hypothetical protein